MSLYNLLFGVNPAAPLLLRLLGLTPADIPRFRDCYLTAEGAEIAIHTRTGGGNREGYALENQKLAQHPRYLRDADDDFDCTYATFYFSVPAPAQKIVGALLDAGADRDLTPKQKWQVLLNDLHAGTQTPDTIRALEVGREIFASLDLSPPGGPTEATRG